MEDFEKNILLYCLDYCIDDFFNSVEKYIKYEENDVKDVVVKNGTAVLWIGACIYKLKNQNNDYTNEEKKIIDAFKAAVNALKHNLTIVKIIDSAIISSPICGSYRSCGNDAGSRFNRKNTRVIIWEEMKSGTVWSNSNINDYNTVLSLKDVHEGIEKIRDIIKKYLN
ncbi:MAG: hypothetical protein J6C46_09140 [Clostridia bacterium]|nr:hypothetical protein [Clostridia bacterium]